jgi:hypothetical protein
MTSFSYGFYRNITSENKPDGLFIEKINTSFINGFIYANPLMSPIISLKMLERIEIKLTRKDPEKYKSSYSEFYNYNYNTI